MRSLIYVLTATVLLTMSGATAQQKDLVLKGGTLIDGTGRAPITDAVIVVEGSRIKAVGKSGQISIPANASIINLAGRTILPGLIDGHVHLQEWQLPMFLPYGVTTIADLNNDTAWILAQRAALKSGKIKGPRLYVSGAILDGTLKGPLNPSNNPPIRTVEDARQHVRDRVAAGVDIIKVDLSITDDQLRAIIEEAKAAGLPVLGHTQNIRRAAAMGFKFEEHMDTMARAILIAPDEKISPMLYPDAARPVPPPQVTFKSRVNPKQLPALVDYLVKQGVYVNPTLGSGWITADSWGWQDRAKAGAELLRDSRLGFVPADVKKAWKDYALPPGPARGGYDIVKEYLREYIQAGGKVVVGTDTGADKDSVPGLAVLEEMQMLAKLGIPPMKVIQGATLWNAEVIKKDKDIGSIEPGKLADFVIIEGDPLANIDAIRNVHMVIKDGAMVDTKYDPKWANHIPQPYITDFDRKPKLQITGMSPLSAHQGDQNVTLEINGTDFSPNAIIRFDSVDLPTHFVSSTKLTASLTPRSLQKLGSFAVYVVNPGAHGTISIPYYFLVDFKH